MPGASARRLPEVEPSYDAPSRPRLRVIDHQHEDRLAGTGRRHPSARMPSEETVRASTRSAEAAPSRRTVVIGGHPTPPRRRAPSTSRHAARPDRLALWAVGLALFMAFMAAATARADAPRVEHPAASAAAISL